MPLKSTYKLSNERLDSEAEDYQRAHGTALPNSGILFSSMSWDVRGYRSLEIFDQFFVPLRVHEMETHEI